LKSGSKKGPLSCESEIELVETEWETGVKLESTADIVSDVAAGVTAG